ncbi:MAG: ketopantoate reductase family protein [Pseudomonadota bacterium]
MNILIVGGGAIGTTYGSYLSKAADSVTLLVRRDDHANAVNSGPITIHYPDKTEEYTLKAITEATADHNFDLIVFCTKVYDLENAFEKARPAVKPDTWVMSIQNGVQHYDLLQKAFPDNTTIGAISYSGLNRKDDVNITSAGTFRTVIGDNEGEMDDVLNALKAVFDKAEMTCDIEVPIKNALWQKQTLTSMQQALACLTGNSFGELLASDHCKTIAREVFEEVQAVAKTQDVNLPDEMCDTVMNNWARIPTHYPSMVADFKGQRRTEIHMANGYIVELAEKGGIKAPLNKGLYHLILAIEEART